MIIIVNIPFQLYCHVLSEFLYRHYYYRCYLLYSPSSMASNWPLSLYIILFLPQPPRSSIVSPPPLLHSLVCSSIPLSLPLLLPLLFLMSPLFSLPLEFYPFQSPHSSPKSPSPPLPNLHAISVFMPARLNWLNPRHPPPHLPFFVSLVLWEVHLLLL